MRNKKKIDSGASDRLFKILMVLVCGFSVVVTLYPIYFVVIASISDPLLVSTGRVVLLPKGISLEGYKRIFEDSRIWLGYRNTIIYTVLGTLSNMLFTIPAAYALSRPDLKGRKAIMFFFTFTMFFGGGLIPTYLLIRNMGLIDNILVMIIPFSVSVFNLIIARTFFENNIPNELLEAAKLDGCSNLRFFTSIVLPLSKSILAVITLYYLVGRWNDWFNPMIYLGDPNMIPLPLVLREILVQNQALSGVGGIGQSVQQQFADVVKYGVIVISTAPILCIYPFIQKHFTQGVMIGSMKG